VNVVDKKRNSRIEVGSLTSPEASTSSTMRDPYQAGLFFIKPARYGPSLRSHFRKLSGAATPGGCRLMFA
jgi:hypothetical protein